MTPVSIAQWPPRGFSGLTLPRLAPPAELLREWKGGGMSESDYDKWFSREILDTLPEKRLIERMLADFGEKIALCCYEKSGDFCHRNLVAIRFREIGIPCSEWRMPKPAATPR